MVEALGQSRQRHRHRRLRRHRRRAGLALVAAQPGRAGVGALRCDRHGQPGQRPGQGEGRDGAARRPLPAHRLRAARRDAPRRHAVEVRRQGRRPGAAAVRARPLQRGRPPADCALQARRGPVRPEAIRRRAAHPGREARRALHRHLRRPHRRHPGCGGTHRGGPRLLPDRARQARRQVAIPQLRAGEARLARRAGDTGRRGCRHTCPRPCRRPAAGTATPAAPKQ